MTTTFLLRNGKLWLEEWNCPVKDSPEFSDLNQAIAWISESFVGGDLEVIEA